jgi:abequosyltransferase
MNKFLLTIAIPTLNRSNYLKGLLLNIFSQIEGSNLENIVQVLVVDGNSSDNTQNMIRELQKKRNIKYHRRKKRMGIDRDILKCVELTEGQYCWLFSDDDRLSDGALITLLKKLKYHKEVTGCFCNRMPFNFKMEKRVSEVKLWPGEIINADRIYNNKTKCFKDIGMDFGFISSQVINKSEWDKIVENSDFGGLYTSYYLMVHIISKMMDSDCFTWLYIHQPLVKQRTGNDSLLNSGGIIKRNMVEHNSFEKILLKHFDKSSKEYKSFFKKMVKRLPRVIVNLKSQGCDYKVQFSLCKLYSSKYKNYIKFWVNVVPIFLIPNIVCIIIRKIYFKYLI